MDRTEINTLLKARHEAFLKCLQELPAEVRNTSPAGKWNPAQQLDHILRSVGPVHLALGLPKWFLRMAFGKPNRSPRSYEEVVWRYQDKLAAGGRASGRFVPPPKPAHSVERMSTDLRKLISKLSTRVGKWSESELDSLLLPHPLLGKLSVREMLYFTAYHVEHHQRIVERDNA
jgi:hypothetical protein